MACDSARVVTVLFGGMGAEGALLGDTWVYDDASWQPVGDGSTAPAPRAAMAFAYDTRRKRNPMEDLADTWEWDGVRWRRVR